MSTAVNGVNATTSTVPVNTSKGTTNRNNTTVNNDKNLGAGDTVEISNKKLTFDEMIEQGILTPEESSFLFISFKTGKYLYTADGTKTYGEIKEELQLKDGALRKSNYSHFEGIEGNADLKKPYSGTKLRIDPKDLPATPMEFKDDDGKELKGFYKTPDGQVYYEVQDGDSQSSIAKMFKSKSLKGYKTDSALEDLDRKLNLSAPRDKDKNGDSIFYPGEKLDLPEKNWFEKLF